MSKFNKNFNRNLKFLINNPDFMSDKLSKMSKILSSHIMGIKSVEKFIESDSPETLRKHVHALMITAAAMAENMYILNLMSMLYMNSNSFISDSAAAMLNVLNLVEKDEIDKEDGHIEVGNKNTKESEGNSQFKTQLPDNDIKTSNAGSNSKKSKNLDFSEIKIEESVSSIKEEKIDEQPIKKKRGRKKKNKD